MRKTITSFALLIAIGIPTLGAFAAGAYQYAAKPAETKTESAVCPVMGSKIPDVKKAAGKSTYKGKIYYFCCKGCKSQFDNNPSKYVK